MFGEKIEVGKKVVFEDVDGRGIDGGLRKDEDEDNDDEDEEEKIWEEEQFRKGLGKRMDDGSSRIVSSNVPVVQTLQHQQKYTYPAEATYSSVPNVSAPPSIGGVLGASQGLDVTSIPQQAEVARKALRENARRLMHKAPFIEELEEQMQKLHEECASAIIEKRAADNDDEMMEVEAAVSAAVSVKAVAALQWLRLPQVQPRPHLLL